MTDFTERYKTYSNSRLLEIIENTNDYQPDAIETAKAIISSRHLTESELEVAKSELDAEKEEKARREQEGKVLKGKLKNLSESALDNINPIQRQSFSAAKTINIITIVLGAIFLFRLYGQFGMIRFMISDSGVEWNLSVMLPLLQLLLMATATVFFWKKKKAGWILAGIFLTHDVFAAIQMFYILLNRPSIEDNPLAEVLLPSVPSVYFIATSLFFIGMLVTICRKNIRDVFSIGKRTMVLTISLTIVIIGLTICLLY